MLGFEQPRSDLAKDRVPALWFCPHSLPSPGRNSDLPGKSEDRESGSQVIGNGLLQIEMLLTSLLNLAPSFFSE